MTRKLLAMGLLVLVAACGGGSSEKKGTQTDLAAGAPGGRGAAGNGGSGGYVHVYSESGDVRLSATPAATTLPSFTYVAPVLGANPRTVAASETLTPTVDGHLVGDDGDSAATALWVKSGVTATLAPVSGNDVVLALDGPIVVDGTLRLGDPGPGASRVGVAGTASGLHVRTGGLVDGKGGDGSAAVNGGTGGNLDLAISGDVFVAGTIDTRGGDGAIGGDGGLINVEVANGWVVVTGLADSSGGRGLAGAGGYAGDAEVWGRWSLNGTGNAYNSGTLRARGGDGTTGGGDGGNVYVSSCRFGWAAQAATGLLDGRGGNATVGGPGGYGGDVEIVASADQVWAAGQLLARGGDGAGGGGGSGGYVYVSSRSASAKPNAVLGGWVAAVLDAAGGDGTEGGGGGDVEIEIQRSDDVDPAPLLVAMGEVSSSGGDGTTGGGPGGILQVDSFDPAGAQARLRPAVAGVGDVTVGVRLTASGGQAGAGDGGPGGVVGVYGDAVGTAELNADGGASTGAAGAPGGSITVAALTPPSTLTGPLTVRGGTGSTAGPAGSVTVDGAVKTLVNGVFTP